ncbi:hypothetical protein L1887_38157 [Cichorium endivia]|nr:hypothetical protein L1887_38157 [Cichorium endivia]
MKSVKPLKKLKLSVFVQSASNELPLSISMMLFLFEIKEIALRFSLEDLETIEVIGKGSGGLVLFWKRQMIELKKKSNQLSKKLRGSRQEYKDTDKEN